MSRETQAMQDDDRVNPGMLWVLEGEALWSTKIGNTGRSCADCHGNAANAMKGVAARYPAFDAKSDRPIDLEQRINRCRTEHQGASALEWESEELLALTTYVARQSHGIAIETGADERLRPFAERGRDLFGQRQGQINIACSQCHDDNWGKRLAGNSVPQGHPTGYPLYRLEWQSMASLQRRLRACMIAIRAQPYDYGAPQNVELELYLMWRARGMPLETPAVRP
jgi:L-cysteine S-thiosulfotransferase